MTERTFSMSMYASKGDLYKAKAEYFENKYKKSRSLLVDLVCRCKTEIPDIKDCSDIMDAIDFLDT